MADDALIADDAIPELAKFDAIHVEPETIGVRSTHWES
jgi:hypothetical protein